MTGQQGEQALTPKRRPSIGRGSSTYYQSLAYSRDQLWLPAGIWVLFAIIAALLPNDRSHQIAAGFLGVALPLLAGMMAGAAILDDPALELQFAAPWRARRILLDRLGVLLGITTVGALSFQIFLVAAGVNISPYGGLVQRQALWLTPSLAMLGLGSVVAMATAQSTTASMLVGIVWLAQLLLRHVMMQSNWARYLFLYVGLFDPQGDYLLANNLCLAVLAGLLVALAWRALERQERYL